MDKEKKKTHSPTFAPGLEQDALKEDATQEEIEQGDSTLVSSLILDRTGDDDR
jgi:hypothetical protein